MNKNKGFIGIGLIIAIVLGIVVVGGGAYYLGKSGTKKEINKKENVTPNNENTGICGNNGEFCPGTPGYEERMNREKQNQPVVDIQKNSNPLITSIFPLSGPIGTIIELKGSNLAGFEGDLDAIIENNKGESAFLKGIGLVPREDQTIRVKIEDKVCKQNNSYSGEPCNSWMNLIPGTYKIYTMPWGKKSNEMTFTINSIVKNISTTLPAKYLGSKNWPPIVKTSGYAYSCKLSSGSGDAPTVIEEKTINGKKYCITSFIDAGAGSRFGEYTYTTPNTSVNGTKTASFNLQWSSCGGYDKPEYDQCQTTVSTFLNKLDVMVDSLM